MTDVQLNYLRMVSVERGILAQLPSIAIYGGNIIAMARKADVDTLFLQILSDAGIQESDLKGTTQSKDVIWFNAATLGTHINLGVKTYAENQSPEDFVLEGQMHYGFSDLGTGAIQDALTRMVLIQGKAGAIPILDLAPFNITAVNLSDFDALIISLTAAAPLHGVMQAAKTASTAEINANMKLLKKAMKKQDNIMRTYKLLHKVFVETYDNGRNIIDLGKTMKAEEIVLHPKEHEALFHNKYLPGDTFTVRHHSALGQIRITLSDNTDPSPTGGFILDAEHDIKLSIPDDIKCPFGHYLIIESLSGTDDIDVTVILAKGKSASKAPSPPTV